MYIISEQQIFFFLKSRDSIVYLPDLNREEENNFISGHSIGNSRLTAHGKKKGI